MFALLYVSSAAKPFTSDELADLMRAAREHNAVADITGMLLYKDGNFMQLLEGPQASVQALFAKIAADPRHTGAITLLRESIADRAFADWSMGFRDLRSPGIAGIPGYSEFLNTPLTGEEFSAQPRKAQKLLLMFKEKM